MADASFDAVLFDLDGTLVDSLEDLADSCNRSLVENGFAPHPTEKYRTFVGDGVVKLIERILPPHNSDAAVVQRVRQRYDALYTAHCLDKTRPYSGILPLLALLKENGVKTAVISNKPHPFTVRIVSALFGDDAFDVVIGQSDQIPRKPDPTGVRAALEMLGVTPENAFYIGDSNVDVRTAANAGVRCIGAAWGFRGKEELEPLCPYMLADSPNAAKIFFAHLLTNGKKEV